MIVTNLDMKVGQGDAKSFGHVPGYIMWCGRAHANGHHLDDDRTPTFMFTI
jgi:hypothetical protein